MASSTRYWTADEVRALPDDGRRYEVIDGVLAVEGVEVPGGDLDAFAAAVTPAPSWSHQRVALALAARLLGYLDEHPIGSVVIAPADVRLGDSLVQPDVFVAPTRSGGAPSEEHEHERQRLLLAIEVLSPGTSRRDRFTKRRLYQREGVPECWIVDLDARAIERWRPGDDRPEVLDERIEWRPTGVEAPLVIELDELFRRVHGN